MKKAILASAIAASASTGAYASTPVPLTDAQLQMQMTQHARAHRLGHSHEHLHRTVQSYKRDSSDTTYEIVVFYQPSYLDTFGHYEGIKRIESQVAYTNSLWAQQGVDIEVSILDIVPITSVPNDIPFAAPRDIDPDTDGYDDYTNFLASVAIYNAGNPENDILEMRQPDGVVVYRESRIGDGGRLGSGATLFGDAAVLDTGTDDPNTVVLAHELGHNLGLDHEITDFVNSNFTHGQAWECGNAQTIMWSSGGLFNPIGYSSPDLEHFGEPCGVENEADNLRVLNEVLPDAVNWRPSVASTSTVSLDASTYFVSEHGRLNIELTRSGDLSEASSVKIFFENDSAVYGQDFFTAFEDVAFAPGQSLVNVSIDIALDGLTEQDETFNIILKYPHLMDISGGAAVVTIADSDITVQATTMNIVANSVVEGAPLSVTVTRSHDVGDAMYRLHLADIEASIGRDIIGRLREFIIADGTDTVVIDIDTTDDVFIEPDETVQATLTTVTEEQQVLASTTLSIKDNDSTTAGELSFDNADTLSVTEGDINIALTIVRSGGFLNDVTGDVVLTFSNATAEQRFPFTIEQGQSSTTVLVGVPDNTLDEANYNASATIEVTSGGATSSGTQSILVSDNDMTSTGNSSDNGASGGGSTGIISLLGLALLTLRRRQLQ